MSVELISANHAAASAVTLAARANRDGRGFASAVYPITPQTECIELLCKQEFDKGSVVRVESEHSAMSVCIGAAFSGARTFTASSSNGLAFMTENVLWAAYSRLPIVMMAVNRTIGPPWNIWADHGDTLMLRDTGWVQLYCEDNQEVLDSMILAFRLAEHAQVLLPVMVCQDAFVLSHTMMPTDVPSQERVDAFLPVLDLPHRLKAVRTIGGLDLPHETEVHRKGMHEAMGRVFSAYTSCQAEFEEVFGRRPADPIVPYRMEDAEVAIVSMGTTAATVQTAVDAVRQRGIRAGGLRVRMFRPFPEQLLRQHLASKLHVAVLDRNLCPGLGGILWSEIRGICDKEALVQDYMLGLGGGDILPKHIEEIIDDLLQRKEPGEPKIMEVG